MSCDLHKSHSSRVNVVEDTGFDTIDSRPEGIEQEETQETGFFRSPSPFSPFAPVQKTVV
jgi:hypothetical protein